jgi:hypothetical protein
VLLKQVRIGLVSELLKALTLALAERDNRFLCLIIELDALADH